MKKTTLSIIIRIVVSLSLLVFLFSKIEFKSLKGILSNFHPMFYLFSLCILFIHQYIWAYAWRLTLLEKNTNVKQKDIFRAVITSNFFGTFLPSSLGPDIVLAFNIGKSLQEKHHAPSSLLFIRLMNITSTLLLSGIVLFFIAQNYILRQILFFTWLLLFILWLCYWLAIHPGFLRFADRITQKYSCLGFVYKIFHSFSDFGRNNKSSTEIWLFGIAMAFIKVFIDYLIALSLGIHIPYIWFLALVPSVIIITLLPISIAGLGVRESAYVAVFSTMGVASAKSLSISLTVFTLNIWLCIIGGTLYLIHGTHIKSKNL